MVFIWPYARVEKHIFQTLFKLERHESVSNILVRLSHTCHWVLIGQEADIGTDVSKEHGCETNQRQLAHCVCGRQPWPAAMGPHTHTQ